MAHFLSILLVGFMVLLGGLPTLYLTISMPIVIGQKIYRKIKFDTSIWD